MNKILTFLIALVLLSACSVKTDKQLTENDSKPNILLIMADDMGFTDIACFGSEVETPNIDGLAEKGMLFTNFHTSVSCSPTRSMLLSGTDNHIAGLGNMGELLTETQKGKPGYEGHLNFNVVSMAEIFKEEGYHTYMAGKWHLGDEPGFTPSARGFERCFSMLQGGASHWSDMYGLEALHQPYARYEMDGEILDELPEDFYSSRSYADFLIDAIRSKKDDGKPFLAYYAPTAAHDPIHVPEPWLHKYSGYYDEGYEVLKAQRIAKIKELGLVDANAKAPGFHKMVTPWNEMSNEEKAFKARTMEAYSGMINNLDYHIGRIINYLKDIGEFENTVILFASDNGPNPWESVEYPGNEGTEWFQQFDNSYENIGRPNSFVGIGIGWAQASAGPLDFFKMTTGEGGIRTPLIMCGPGIPDGHKTEAFAYVTDVLPTLLEMTGTKPLKTYKGKTVEEIRGVSMVPVISGEKQNIYPDDQIICGEMLTGKWARKGDFKATLVDLAYSDATWRLYNTKTDPGETNDLSESKPELFEELVNAWLKYSQDVGVVD